MSKIAIATMVGQNHGNRLQNYALQTVLERMTGCRVETLKPCYGPNSANQAAKAMLRHVIPQRRWARFASFDARHMRFSTHRMDDARLSDAGYDLFVIGSDQVWNPTFDITGDAEYLPQVEKDKKVAYAASFGVDRVSDDDGHIGSLLNDIARISVREEAGQAIVRELSGCEAQLVLDPTLLLTAGDWLAVAQKPKLPVNMGSYQLTYALGEGVIPQVDQTLDLVDLRDRNLPIGPAEFVWLIAHAACVCTDSYHAALFSLLMHTPFIIYGRQSHNEDMSSRFETLAKQFDLQMHRENDGAKLMSSSQIDWDHIDRLRAYHRSQSTTFLEEALRDANLI